MLSLFDDAAEYKERKERPFVPTQVHLFIIYWDHLPIISSSLGYNGPNTGSGARPLASKKTRSSLWHSSLATFFFRVSFICSPNALSLALYFWHNGCHNHRIFYLLLLCLSPMSERPSSFPMSGLALCLSVFICGLMFLASISSWRRTLSHIWQVHPVT